MDIEVDQYTVTSGMRAIRDGLQDFFSRLVDSGRSPPSRRPPCSDYETGDYLYEVDVSGELPRMRRPAPAATSAKSAASRTLRRPGQPAQPAGRRRRPKQRPRPLHPAAARVRAAEVADHHRLGRVPARLRELAGRVFARPSSTFRSPTLPTGASRPRMTTASRPGDLGLAGDVLRLSPRHRGPRRAVWAVTGRP